MRAKNYPMSNHDSGRELFERRIEPNFLACNGSGYPNLRTARDIELLQKALSYVVSNRGGGELVIASWISPPFGIILGYGVYSRKDAEMLAERSKHERWGFPRFGSVYDVKRLEERIARLSSPSKSGILACKS